MNHRSLAFRLAVWYTLLLSATFTLVGAGMFYGLEHYLRSSLRDSLRRRSEQIEQILAQAPAAVSPAAIAEAINTRVAPEFNNRFVRVTRAPGAMLYRSGQPADRSFDRGAVAPVDSSFWLQDLARRTVTVGPQHLMVSATPLDTPSGRYLIEMGGSLESVELVQDREVHDLRDLATADDADGDRPPAHRSSAPPSMSWVVPVT